MSIRKDIPLHRVRVDIVTLDQLTAKLQVSQIQIMRDFFP